MAGEKQKYVCAGARVLMSQDGARVSRDTVSDVVSPGTQCQGVDKRLSLTALGAFLFIRPFVHGEVRTHTLFVAPHVMSDMCARSDRLRQRATGIAQT